MFPRVLIFNFFLVPQFFSSYLDALEFPLSFLQVTRSDDGDLKPTPQQYLQHERQSAEHSPTHCGSVYEITLHIKNATKPVNISFRYHSQGWPRGRQERHLGHGTTEAPSLGRAASGFPNSVLTCIVYFFLCIYENPSLHSWAPGSL